MDTSPINNIKRWIGIKSIEVGVAQIRQVEQDVSHLNDNGDIMTKSIAGIDGNLSPIILDSKYYYTSWEDWQMIVSLLNDITKTFVWEAERFDCDKRANLIASLSSLLFRLNTCLTVYCQVIDPATNQLKYLHYANIIVDDKGICYLWDLDNNGITQKITGNNMIMGGLKYKFISVRTI